MSVEGASDDDGNGASARGVGVGGRGRTGCCGIALETGGAEEVVVQWEKIQ